MTTLLANSAALALPAVYDGLSGAVEQVLRKPLAPYADAPRAIAKGTGRDEARSGWWTPRLRRDLENVRLSRELENSFLRGEVWASIDPLALTMATQGNASVGGPDGGEPIPGEGGGGNPGPVTGGGGGSGAPSLSGGMGGETNTNTGNKLTSVSLFDWAARGDAAVSFELSHSSRDSYAGEVGTGWTHSYEATVSYTPGSSAILRMPDGTTVPFTETSPGVFTRPSGFHASLARSATKWTLSFRGSRTVWEFDLGGKLARTLDRSGNAVVIGRDAQGRTSTITDPSGRAASVTYAPDGRMAQIADHTGRVWKFTRNAAMNLTLIEYPAREGLPKYHVFGYDAAHRILSHQDRRGATWTWTYDSSGRILTARDPLNRTTNYAYTATATTITTPQGRTRTDIYSNGLLQSRVDEAGFSESYAYDGDRNVTQRTDKRGKIWNAAYNASGDRTSYTNPLGRTWTTTYDVWGQPLSTTTPLGIATSNTYDAAGRPTTIVDGMGKQTGILYDAFGQPTSVTDPTGKTTSIEYDADGNVTKVTDPAGVATRRSYNALGWLTSTRDAANTEWTRTYDAWGMPRFTFGPHGIVNSRLYNSEGQLVVAADDGMGRTTHITVDGAGQTTAVQNPKGETETYTYNLDGELTSVTNGRGKTRVYLRAARGEESRLTHADGTVEERTYYATGELATVRNGAGQTSQIAIDDVGRVTLEDHPTGTADVSYTYDFDGRRTGMTDASGSSTWTYDAAGRTTSLAQPAGTVGTTYDDAGRVLSTTQPGALVTQRGYDAFGRAVSATSPFGETSSSTYDALGRVWKTVYGNGTYEERTFDLASRPLTIVLRNASGTALRSEALTYNQASQILTRTVGGVQTGYAYDANGRLTGESRPGYSAAYTWDGNGNRTSRTVNGVLETASYDDGDKLLDVRVGAAVVRSYVYDGAGRAISVNGASIAWDARGYATSVAGIAMTTNGDGARVREGTSDLLRDGSDVLAGVLSDGGATYVPGLSERRSGITTYMQGGDKSVEARTGSTGVVSGTRAYDAFGNAVGTTGTWAGPSGYGGQFGYREDGTALRLVGHRLYDPAAGRFLSRDPARDGGNWYAYCGGDPVNMADRGGLEPQWLTPPGFGLRDPLPLRYPLPSDPFPGFPRDPRNPREPWPGFPKPPGSKLTLYKLSLGSLEVEIKADLNKLGDNFFRPEKYISATATLKLIDLRF